MTPLVDRDDKFERRTEEELLKALDKGIDDMEQGRTMPHEEAMKLLRERVKSYGI